MAKHCRTKQIVEKRYGLLATRLSVIEKLPAKAITDIIHVRIVELFEIIFKELGDLIDPKELGGG